MIHELNLMLSNPIIPFAGAALIVVLGALLGRRSERKAAEKRADEELLYGEAFQWPPRDRRAGR